MHHHVVILEDLFQPPGLLFRAADQDNLPPGIEPPGEGFSQRGEGDPALSGKPHPAFAAAVYFAIAFVLNHSGKVPVAGGPWAANPEGGSNMVQVVAEGSAALFRGAYVGVAAFLGLLGGFISGSETSSIAMLTKLHFETVRLVFAGATPERILSASLLVAAASAIGGGLASVISPAKLQNAAAVIDRIGMEGKVIRSTAVVAAIMVLGVALLTLVFLAWP